MANTKKQTESSKRLNQKLKKILGVEEFKRIQKLSKKAKSLENIVELGVNLIDVEEVKKAS